MNKCEKCIHKEVCRIAYDIKYYPDEASCRDFKDKNSICNCCFASKRKDCHNQISKYIAVKKSDNDFEKRLSDLEKRVSGLYKIEDKRREKERKEIIEEIKKFKYV